MRVFNINDRVTVTLTLEGHHVLEAWCLKQASYVADIFPNALHTQLNEYRPDGGNTGTFSMWEFMAIFGAHCYNGCPQLFVDNAVEIERR